jgi:hypothetical protein
LIPGWRREIRAAIPFLWMALTANLAKFTVLSNAEHPTITGFRGNQAQRMVHYVD